MAAQETDPEPGPEPAQGNRPAWSRLHLWQIQPVRDVLLVFLLIVVLILGERLSLVTVPLLLALMLAYLFEPVVVRLSKASRMNRRLAAGAVVVSSILFLAVPACLILAFGVLQGVDFAANIATKTNLLVSSLQDPTNAALREELGVGPWLETRDFLADLRTRDEGEWEDVSFLGIDRTAMARGVDIAIAWIRDHSQELAMSALDTGRGALLTAVSVLFSVGKAVFGGFLTAFFFFFFSTGWPEVRRAAEGLLPEESHDRTLAILAKMDRAIHGFVRGRLTIGLFLAAFYTIGFWAIGAPAPLILGPVVAMITLIPYAALLAVPVVIVLVWLEGHPGLRGSVWWVLLAPFVVYQIGQALDDYVLTPMIQGKSTDLTTPTILFASISGGILLGIFGLLVAIPLAACARILWIEIFRARFVEWLRTIQREFLPAEPG